MRCYLAGEFRWWTPATLLTARDVRSTQAQAVLAVLATARGDAVHRDVLVEELWGGEPPDAWETALRALVSKLRRVLSPGWRGEPDVIGSIRGSYQLLADPGSFWVDVNEAHSALHRAEVAARVGGPDASSAGDALVACQIASRPLLVGLDGPWVVEQRRRLSDVHVRAREHLARIWLASGDPALAVRDARAAIAADPYRESSHEILIRAYASCGNRAAAVASFIELRSLLANDLDLAPSALTMAAYRDALAGGRGSW